MKSIFALGVASALILSPGLSFGQTPVYPDLPESSSTTEATTPSTPSWAVSEVEKLSQAGVDESVIRAYIDKSPNSFQLSAQDVLRLKDSGVSSDVISAMLEHDNALATAPNGTSTPPVATTETGDGNVLSAAENAPPEVKYFYNDLNGYGRWIYLDGYGWCWQPNVVSSDPNWRPYCDEGQWLYSDVGWYWHSFYPWGWAPFHYGRWWNASCGWVWFPDTVWAPSWVTWRFSDPFCGWAPLPPFPFFRHRGSHFDVNFGFNLGPGAFTFVHFGDVFARDVFARRIPRTQVNNFFGRTTVAHNFSRGSHDSFINHGIPISHVAAVTGRTVPTVRVSSGTVDPRRTQPDRIVQQGSQLTVARPHLTAPSRTTRMFAQRIPSGSTIRSSSVQGGAAIPSPQSHVTAPTQSRPSRLTSPKWTERPGPPLREPAGAAIPSAPPRTTIPRPSVTPPAAPQHQTTPLRGWQRHSEMPRGWTEPVPRAPEVRSSVSPGQWRQSFATGPRGWSAPMSTPHFQSSPHFQSAPQIHVPTPQMHAMASPSHGGSTGHGNGNGRR